MIVRLKQPTELKGDTTMKNNITSKQACTIAHKIRRETGCSLADAFKAAYAGNNSVNPKTSWTAEDLNKIFSDKTAELLRKGYIIDTAAMSGHQGEICKIIFKKNNDYYILIMSSKSDWSMGKYNEQYIIRFGKYNEKVENHGLNAWITLWIEKFDTIWSLEFIKITNNFFVTAETAKAMNEKRSKRCHNSFKNRYEEVTDRYTKAVLGCVRKQKGYKGVKANEILKVTRITTFNDFEGAYNKRYYRVTLTRTYKSNGKNVELDIRF